LQVQPHPLASVLRVYHGAHLVVHDSRLHEMDVADQAGVAHRDLDMRSLTEERAREGGRSLGEHSAHGTDPHACTLEDRIRELNDLAVEPVFAACLSGNRNALRPSGPEQLVVRLGQDRHPAHTVLEVNAVLKADVSLDDRRLARMRSLRPCAGWVSPSSKK
jgi:hypothetical protein